MFAFMGTVPRVASRMWVSFKMRGYLVVFDRFHHNVAMFYSTTQDLPERSSCDSIEGVSMGDL